MHLKDCFNSVRNKIGHMKGYGHCYHCNGTWNYKRAVCIPCDGKLPNNWIQATYPLCEECFDKLSVDEIYDYCIKYNNRKDIDLKIIYENIRYLKGIVVVNIGNREFKQG